MFRLQDPQHDMAAHDGRPQAIASRDARSAVSRDIPDDFELALADPALEQFDRAMAMSPTGLCTWVIRNMATAVKTYLVKILELDGNVSGFETSEILQQQKEP